MQTQKAPYGKTSVRNVARQPLRWSRVFTVAKNIRPYRQRRCADATETNQSPWRHLWQNNNNYKEVPVM